MWRFGDLLILGILDLFRSISSGSTVSEQSYRSSRVNRGIVSHQPMCTAACASSTAPSKFRLRRQGYFCPGGRVTAIYTTFPYIKYIKNLALNLALNLAVRIKKTCGILVPREVVPRYWRRTIPLWIRKDPYWCPKLYRSLRNVVKFIIYCHTVTTCSRSPNPHTHP